MSFTSDRHCATDSRKEERSFEASTVQCPTLNNSKTDYNIANAGQPWNESIAKAHYRNRQPSQPFFPVFNLVTSHESQVAPKPGKTTFRVPPEKVVLPPYHPDTLPMLVRMLKSKDSRVGLWIRSMAEKHKLARKLVRLKPPNAWTRQIGAVVAFHQLGSQAAPAIPVTIRLLDDSAVRSWRICPRPIHRLRRRFVDLARCLRSKGIFRMC